MSRFSNFPILTMSMQLQLLFLTVIGWHWECPWWAFFSCVVTEFSMKNYSHCQRPNSNGSCISNSDKSIHDQDRHSDKFESLEFEQWDDSIFQYGT